MNKQYSKEEKLQLVAECTSWIAKGKSVTSFAQSKGIPKGTVFGWISVKKSPKRPSKRTLVPIPKTPKKSSTTPVMVEMRCGSLSFVFNEGYSEASVEAIVRSLKKCGLL